MRNRLHVRSDFSDRQVLHCGFSKVFHKKTLVDLRTGFPHTVDGMSAQKESGHLIRRFQYFWDSKPST